MKRQKNIYKLLLVFILALGLYSCQKAATRTSPADEQATTTTERGFDPLDLPSDNVIVPKQFPQKGEISGSGVVSKESMMTDDSTGIPVEDLPDSADSLNNQAYRIQIFSSKVYGEARHEAKIAEEIFDRPLSIDYEVPYYKIRVGSFQSRDQAEEYQMKAKAAGYTNAWVALVNINVKETAPLYDGEQLLPPANDSLNVSDSLNENSNDEN